MNLIIVKLVLDSYIILKKDKLIKKIIKKIIKNIYTNVLYSRYLITIE